MGSLRVGYNWVTSLSLFTLMLWRRKWQPTRLPDPWDSPGKNTGVGCHFLLQCMKVKSESEVPQLYPTLSDPMDCSLPGFPFLHCLPEFAQTHVLWVSNAIQPSYPLSPLSPLALNLSQHQSFPMSQLLSFSFSISPSNEYVPDTVLSITEIFTHFIITATLWGRY